MTYITPSTHNLDFLRICGIKFVFGLILGFLQKVFCVFDFYNIKHSKTGGVIVFHKNLVCFADLNFITPCTLKVLGIITTTSCSLICHSMLNLKCD